MEERKFHTYQDVEDIFSRYIHKKEDVELIHNAYLFAEEKHAGPDRPAALAAAGSQAHPEGKGPSHAPARHDRAGRPPLDRKSRDGPLRQKTRDRRNHHPHVRAVSGGSA